MSVLAAALVLVGAALCALAAHRHARRIYAAVSGLAVIGVLGIAVTWGLRPAEIGVTEILAGAFVVLGAAEAFGLPGPFARRLGIGRRSREWEFDREIGRRIDELNLLLARHPGSGNSEQLQAWGLRVVRDGTRLGDRLRSLKAPDPRRRALADGYASLCDLIVEDVRSGQDADRRQSIDRLGLTLAAQREGLRDEYRSHATEG